MDSQAILFTTILILISVAIIGGCLYVGKKDGKEEAERHAKELQNFSAAIDHTDLMAFSDNESVYRVHYKDGTTDIVRVGRAHPNEKVYFNKLI